MRSISRWSTATRAKLASSCPAGVATGRGQGALGEPRGGVVLALTDEPQSTRAWAVGAWGEAKLAEALDGFTVLHDRCVPGTNRNIDHVVVAPAGVFVVDAKRYEGRIEICNHGWFLRSDERLHVGRRDCSALAENMGPPWDVGSGRGALIPRAGC